MKIADEDGKQGYGVGSPGCLLEFWRKWDSGGQDQCSGKNDDGSLLQHLLCDAKLVANKVLKQREKEMPQLLQMFSDAASSGLNCLLQTECLWQTLICVAWRCIFPKQEDGIENLPESANVF